MCLSLSPTWFPINEAVTGSGAQDLRSFALQMQGHVCPFLFSSVYCLTSVVVQIVAELPLLKCSWYEFWNYLTRNAWCLQCQNSKGATKNVHSVLPALHKPLCDICMSLRHHLHWTVRAWLALTVLTVSILNKQALMAFAIECTTASLVLWACQVLKIRHTGSAFIIYCCFSWQAESLLSFWQYIWIPDESFFWLYLHFKSKFCCLVWKAALYRATLRNNHCVAQLCAIF